MLRDRVEIVILDFYQALPRLFSLAANNSQGEGKQFASSTLSSIESLNRNRARLNKVPETMSRKRYVFLSSLALELLAMATCGQPSKCSVRRGLLGLNVF